jgi:hypothetical protein
MLLERSPGTPLRVFCIAAFEYLARLRGGTLGRRRRLALAHACDFGSLRDQYYDERTLDRSEYRRLRRALRRFAPEAATARYIRELRSAERNRPGHGARSAGAASAAASYRASVIRLSLRWLHAIAEAPWERSRSPSIVSLVCSMQLADDLLDWEEDQACRCPTYVTALLHGERRSSMALALRLQAKALLHRMLAPARKDAAAAPFALAGIAVWAFVICLLQVRLPR